MNLKFGEDCIGCANRRKRWVCRDCDVGELFEDEDRPGVDAVLRDDNPALGPSRFGEALPSDDDLPAGDKTRRLLEQLDSDDGDEEDGREEG